MRRVSCRGKGDGILFRLQASPLGVIEPGKRFPSPFRDPGGRNVLFADGHVGWPPQEELQRPLSRQKGAARVDPLKEE
ncbi:MAG: hypothetical protein KAX80_11965 [Planctomycetes bacterium]|nr:hypothetical protein [Planctomycetota bacterium]